MAKTVGDLNEMFKRSEQALQAHFAEIRTNILLDTGNHHPKAERINNTRMFRDMNQKKKIRITKNHIQVITKFIRNSIQNRAPDGAVYPRNQKETSDQKAAELNNSVYEFLKTEGQLTSVYAGQVHDFVVSGETHTKVFFDPRAGAFMGYEEEPEEDEEGDVEVEDDDEDEDEYGEKSNVIRMRKGRPKFKGKIIYERIPPYNFLTDPDADSERTNYWVCIRKYIPRKKLEERYLGDKEKMEIVEKSSTEKSGWFNGFTGIYSDQNSDEVELREFYFKVCEEYPEGAYIFATDYGILEEGELPDGFCIFSEVFDESPENPRGYSIIKQAKPYQVEINRCAAAVITESIVLGHSTLLYPAGEKPASSGIGNGIKGIAYHSVKEPTLIPGRNGDQYIEYMNQQIDEMYRVCMVPNQDEDKNQGGTNDGQAMLGRALRDKMRFSLYGEKIENLICRMIDYSLRLARRYLPDDEIIPIIGKTEAVNIAEFKNTTPQQYQIKIKPRSDDFTSVYGKSIQIVQALQYVGSQLPPEAIASMVRKLPFLNEEAILKDYTIWEDQADAIILSLDRGEIPFFFEKTNHDYLVTRLQMRMNENDFPLLSPQIQMNYNDRYQAHLQVMSQQEQEAANAASGMIPASGGLVSVDYYISTPDGKQQRARLPYAAVEWLVNRLKEQSHDVEKITNLPLGAQADLGVINQQQGVSSQPQAAPQQGNMPMTGS